MSKLTDFFPQSTQGSSSSSDANALSADLYVDIVLIGGGGGGSTSYPQAIGPYTPNSPCSASAGGAGGYFRGRYGIRTGTVYPVVIGAGGAAAPTSVATPTSFGGRGGNTKFDNGKLIGYGGGGAGSFCKCACPTWASQPCCWVSCTITISGTPGGTGGLSPLCGTSVECLNIFGCHSNACNPTSPLNGLSLDFAGNCVICPGLFNKSPNANTGNGGASSCDGTSVGYTGSSGFAIVSYPTNSAPAATSTPGAVNCSPQTPGYYTYVYTSTGSFTL